MCKLFIKFFLLAGALHMPLLLGMQLDYYAGDFSESLSCFDPQAAFNEAVAENDCATLDYLCLLYSQSVNTAYKGMLPLSLAAYSGCAEALMKIIKMGANSNAQDMHGNTALMWALANTRNSESEERLLEIVRILLEDGASVTCKNNLGKTPLMLAAAQGYSSIVKLLLEYGAEIYEWDVDGRTCMYIALSHMHASIIMILLEHGAFLDFENIHTHKKILPIIAELSDTEMIIPFIALIDQWGDSAPLLDKALFQAIASKKIETVRVLVDYGANVHAVHKENGTTLQQAITSGCLELVHFFLDHCVDIDRLTSTKNSALHLAASANFIQAAELLIERGARLDISNSQDMTPLEIAAMHGYKEIVDALKNKVSTKRLGLAMIKAVQNSQLSVCELLVSPSTVNARNEELVTPFIAAAINGDIHASELLYRAGAGVDLQDMRGSTALLLACFHNHIELIEFLIISCKCDPNKSNNVKISPLHMCVIKNNLEGVTLLLKYGAYKNLKNKKDETAADIAQSMNQTFLYHILKCTQ